jgi:hypothetical protein|eukprot:COSAG01_NODE_12369_length_1750_cov_1.150030_4_plen_71_part_00
MRVHWVAVPKALRARRTNRLCEVAEASLNKQSQRAAGLQAWYEQTAQAAMASQKAQEEASVPPPLPPADS